MSQTLEALVVELRADIKGLQSSLQTAAGDVSKFSNTASKNMDGFQASINRARIAVAGLGLGFAALSVGKGIVDAGMQMQALQNKMLAATGSSQVAASAMEFVRAESDRLGLSITATASGFAGFAASSLRAGLESLAGIGARAALVLLVDQPGIGARAVRRVLEAYEDSGSLVCAAYDGVRGHPVLFGAAHWAPIAATATGDRGARAYLREHERAITLVECGDVARPYDIDTEADLVHLE